ncbi:Gfo/Idh/MocA family oxidoreductase [Pseudonocardia sp. DLS-67]
MLASDVDAVAIFTQRWTHGPLVVAALEAGKHVYSAVPMAITADEIGAIIEAVRKTGLTYMMGETELLAPGHGVRPREARRGRLRADLLHRGRRRAPPDRRLRRPAGPPEPVPRPAGRSQAAAGKASSTSTAARWARSAAGGRSHDQVWLSALGWALRRISDRS